MARILIVDDLMENRMLLEMVLKAAGYDVRAASNGAEALGFAIAELPTLIISDILMPVMDGFSLCRYCKADARLKRVPFIFYTSTFTGQRDSALALGLGAEQFVIKPQEPDALVSIIQQAIGKSAQPTEDPTAEAGGAADQLLKEHNEALFRKLEKKMADLEATNQELEQRIGEQRRLEEQLRQAQKMEAIGRFSAGIAHDLNNILMVILGYADMMRLSAPEGSPAAADLANILEAGQRGRNLANSLLTFARKHDPQVKRCDLNDTIRNGEKFLRRVLGDNLRLELRLASVPLPVVADSGNLEQVLMNLAANARDAMPNGGKLTIGTEMFDVDATFAQTHALDAAGSYVALSVADTGIGMDAVTQQRIFEPFFTTKPSGQGTGLGLSIIYGIIQQHRGHIWVESELGRGSEFRILLPLASASAATSVEGAPGRPPVGKGETLLVADDDQGIRQFLMRFFTQLGYNVVIAADGKEALAKLADHAHPVDLVLLDVIMPAANGVEVAHQIHNQQPRAKVMLMSGFPPGLLRDREPIGANELLLAKPLLPTELAVRVRVALDQVAV